MKNQQTTFKRDFEMRYGVSPDNGKPTPGKAQPDTARHSPNCKGTPRYYDGALGYEAMKCDVCGYEQDLNAEANAKATAEREARHSPLPWQDTDRHDNPKTCDPFVKIDNERSGIAYVFGDTKPEREANARLIVRAVNNADKLAEALRESAEAMTHASALSLNVQNYLRVTIKKAWHEIAAYERSAQ